MMCDEIAKLKELLSQKIELLKENEETQTKLRKESDKIYNDIFEIRSTLAVKQRKALQEMRNG